MTDDAFDLHEWAQGEQKRLQGFLRPVVVASPCIGLDSPAQVARAVGVPWVSNNVFDIRSELRVPLAKLHGAEEVRRYNLGQECGDLCSVRPHTLQDSDGLISGPPCIATSLIGSRRGKCDGRSFAFHAVASWVVELAKRGCLRFFIIENVVGMLRKCKGDVGECICDDFVNFINTHLPDWHVRAIVWNSGWCKCPQFRLRVFVRGCHPCLRQTKLQRSFLDAEMVRYPPVPLVRYLQPHASESDFDKLSLQQRMNVQVRLHEMLEQHTDSDIGVVDISRDPVRKFPAQIALDKVHTIRCNNEHLWILPSARLQHVFGPRGRRMNEVEKAVCCGVDPSIIEGSSLSSIRTSLGNTIPVPLMAAILLPVLKSMLEHQRIDAAGLSHKRKHAA